jgi:hypothetical protein
MIGYEFHPEAEIGLDHLGAYSTAQHCSRHRVLEEMKLPSKPL